MPKWLNPQAPFYYFPKRRPGTTPGHGPDDTLDPLPISTGYTGQPNGLPPAWTRSSVVNRAYPAINSPYPFGYGQVQGMGSQIWRDTGPDPFSGTRTVMGVVCYGPVNSLAAYQVDGTAPANHVGLILNYYTGTAAQTVDPYLAMLGETSGFPGLAYWVMVTPNSAEGNSINVQNVITDGQLLLVRDPRTDPTLVNRYYRRNPALAIADLLTSKRYGARVPDSAINWTSVGTAADDCDALLADGITPRFTLDILCNNAQTPDNHVQNLRAHAQLNVTYNNGQWQIWMDKQQSWSGVSFFDNAPGGQIIQASPYKISGSTQVFTRVRGDFWNLAGRKADFAIDEDPDITTGLVEMVPQTYSLLGSSTNDQTVRLSRYLRKLAAFDKVYQLRVGPSGARVLPGLRIQVTSLDNNWSNQDVFVTDAQPAPDPDGFGLSGLAWDLSVRKYDDSLYDDTQVVASTNTTPAVPSPYDVTHEWPYPIDASHSLIQLSGNKPFLHFKAATGRTRTLYPTWVDTGFGGGITGFNSARMNDGSTALVAGTLAASNGFYVDLGTAKQIDEVLITVTSSVNVLLISKIKPSATTSFTGASIGYASDAQNLSVAGGAVSTYRIRLAAAGAFRYLAIFCSAVMVGTVDILECQLFEYGGLAPFITGTLCFDISNGSESLIRYVPVTVDVNANPIDLSSYVRTETGGLGRVAIRLRSLYDTTGALSDAYDSYLASSYIAAGSPLATLAGTESFANKALDSSNTVVTQAGGDNSTKPASTAFVTAAIAALITGVSSVAGLVGVISATALRTAIGFVSDILGLAFGGTGSDLSGTGGANKILKQSTLGGAITVAALVSGDIPANAANTSGNAATVTTNANLTGPITSTGNATAVASQTGTGSKFMMDTGPSASNPTFTGFERELAAADITLVNGNNNDVTVNGTWQGVVGPTGAFTVTGIAGGTDGKIVVLLNTVNQTMTVSFNDALSLAANRILSKGFANVVVAGYGVVTFRYRGSAWQVVAVN